MLHILHNCVNPHIWPWSRPIPHPTTMFHNDSIPHHTSVHHHILHLTIVLTTSRIMPLSQPTLYLVPHRTPVHIPCHSPHSTSFHIAQRSTFHPTAHTLPHSTSHNVPHSMPRTPNHITWLPLSITHSSLRDSNYNYVIRFVMFGFHSHTTFYTTLLSNPTQKWWWKSATWFIKCQKK